MESGLHRSVGDTHQLIAHARRLRSEYLRISMRQVVSWVMRRWSQNWRADVPAKESSGRDIRTSQITSRTDTLKKAA